MHEGKFVFSQLMEFVPWRRFQTCVNRYGGDYIQRYLQLLCAQEGQNGHSGPVTP